MSIHAIADRLVTLCRQANWEAAQRELYAEDAVSIEQMPTPVFPKETKGLAAIVAKGHTFNSLIETLHSIEVSAPLVAAGSFACAMTLDVTMKGRPRSRMTEICLYHVKDGKIVSEQFHL